jgi:hypothetical protein
MDAMTEFVATNKPELGATLTHFVVSGASKRGWTTWLTGIVDPNRYIPWFITRQILIVVLCFDLRVVAIVPIVLDIINFVTTEHHQYRSYGGWTWAINDYWECNVMERVDTPEMTELQKVIDPFFYLDRLTMPKLIVNAVLDEFMQPGMLLRRFYYHMSRRILYADDTHYWWNDMPEPKHFLMTPNAEHSEATGLLEVVPAVTAWIDSLLKQQTVPTFNWTIAAETGEITAVLDHVGKVHKASVWWAYSCGNNAKDGVKRRDFRIMSLDNPCECGFTTDDGFCVNTKSFWTQEELKPSLVAGSRVYKAKVAAPEDGRYVAFFIDIKYEAANNSSNYSAGHDGPVPHDRPGQLEFTTEVSVWPNTFPYEACSGVECNGSLL